MSSHYANFSTDVLNLDSAEEADDVAAPIEDALGGAGYKATVSITTGAYPVKEAQQ